MFKTAAGKRLFFLFSLGFLAGCGDTTSTTSTDSAKSETLVSLDPVLMSASSGESGVAGDKESTAPSISEDGKTVVFTSTSTNLVDGDTNAVADVFLRKLSDLSTTRISLDSGGAQLTVASVQPALSTNGLYVTYVISYTGASQVVLYDVQAKTTVNVSQKDGSTATGQTGGGGGNSTEPSISSDGRYVVFTSAATDLLAAGKDANGVADIYLRDTVAKTTVRVSETTKGEANKASSKPRISSDGTYVVYVSEATNLVTGDANGVADIFLYNVGNKTTTRVSVASDGTEANAASFGPFVAKEGAYVMFASGATNLISGDGNGTTDVFVYTKASGAVERISFEPGTGTKEERKDKSASAGGIADDGRYATLVLLAETGTKGPTQALSVYQFSNGRTLKINPAGGTQITFSIALVSATMTLDGKYIIIQAQNWPLTLRDQSIGAGPHIIRVANPLFVKK